jgi:hypothetical protein
MVAAPDSLASSSRATSSDVAGASPRKARKLVSSSPQKSPILAATAASFPKETDKVIILSLIYVRLHRSPPFAAALFDYQKRRVKKLKKQMGGQFD